MLDEDENPTGEQLVFNIKLAESAESMDIDNLAGALRNGRTVVIADTPVQVGKITDALAQYRKGNPNKKFLLITDECDAMFRTSDHSQRFEEAYDRLLDLKPCVHVFVSATPLPALIVLADKEEVDGIPVALFDMTPSDEYVGLAEMEPFSIDNKHVYLEQDELKPTRDSGLRFHDRNGEEMIIPSCSETLRAFYHSAITSQGKGILLLDCTIYYVTEKKKFNVTKKAELVQLYANDKHSRHIAVLTNTGGLDIQVKLSTKEPWLNHQDLNLRIKGSDEDTRLSKAIQFVHDSVGPNVPIFGFGFHKMFRSNSYRSSDRVPTHITVSLGEGHNASTVTQALGRGLPSKFCVSGMLVTQTGGGESSAINVKSHSTPIKFSPMYKL